MLLRPCNLQYIIHFPGSRKNSRRPLDAAQTVYFTIELFTFLGLGGTPGDRSMLLRPCILQYIIHFHASLRNSRRPLDAAQTVYFTLNYSHSSGLSGTPGDRQLKISRIRAQCHFEAEGVFAAVFEQCSRQCSRELTNLHFQSCPRRPKKLYCKKQFGVSRWGN